MSQPFETAYLDQPKRIIVGFEVSRELVQEIRNLSRHPTNVFVVCDSYLTKTKTFEEILTSLREDGLNVHAFEVFWEPTVDAVSKMVASLRGLSCDCVVGMGGGSSLDMAKFAAILYSNKEGLETYLNLGLDGIEKPLPKILVPTTAGSGSEVSSFAVAIGEDHVKRFLQGPPCLADVAIIDPVLAVTCPPKVTAASGMDAFGTAAEAILSKKATPLSDILAANAVRLVAGHLRSAFKNGEDRNARYQMALAAMFAGLAVNTPAAVNIAHCIAEIIGPKYGIPHGEAVGIATPHSMHFNLPASEKMLVKVGEAMGIETRGLSSAQVASRTVNAVSELCSDLGIPSSYRHLGLTDRELDEIAHFIVDTQVERYGLREVNPVELTFENVRALLAKMCS